MAELNNLSNTGVRKNSSEILARDKTLKSL